MAWIRILNEREATGELQEAYEDVLRKRGKIAEIMRIHSLRPRAMKAHLNLYHQLLFEPSHLTREELEILATVVSSLNGCQYCIRHHAEALLHYWKDEKRVQRLVKDFRSADLPEKTLKMLEYARKLTREPSVMKQGDVEVLRQSGFSDEDILHIALTVSYFNFVNRIASGLGVEFTEEEIKGYRYG